jgi:alanine racemase
MDAKDGFRVIEGGAHEPCKLPSITTDDRRWAWVEIDREAIRHNLKAIRRHIGARPAILAVVKADGYGHGAVETARIAVTHGARILGVASVAEGIELRTAGISAPILVLSEPPAASIAHILHSGLTPTVYTMEFALALGEAAAAAGRQAPYHLKVDTGMNRVGVHHSDAGDFLRSLDFHSGLALEGVFTHLATADTLDELSVKMQLSRFEEALEVIRYMGISPGIVHAAGTAGALRYKQTHYDMVRIGLAMYGLHPSETTQGLINLRPAMSVRSRVIDIKPLQVGEGVSYGFTYRSPGNVQIATIPIGYGDGLARELSNRIDVLVHGRACPQVGTICMDMCMFEIDQRSSARHGKLDVERGDEVVIVGKSGQLMITLDDMARALGTINYDIACRFGLRMEKSYVN